MSNAGIRADAVDKPASKRDGKQVSIDGWSIFVFFTVVFYGIGCLMIFTPERGYGGEVDPLALYNFAGLTAGTFLTLILVRAMVLLSRIERNTRHQ